jgi:hypothetical protein
MADERERFDKGNITFIKNLEKAQCRKIHY